MASLIILTVALALNVYSVFADGYVLSKLWEWNAVPLGYRALSWSVFAAGSIALSICRPSSESSALKEEDEADEFARRVIPIVIMPWVMLLIGWAFKS